MKHNSKIRQTPNPSQNRGITGFSPIFSREGHGADIWFVALAHVTFRLGNSFNLDFGRTSRLTILDCLVEHAEIRIRRGLMA